MNAGVIIQKWMNMWEGVRPLYDSPSMPVRGLGCSFEGVPGGDKWLFLKTQGAEKRKVRKSHEGW